MRVMMIGRATKASEAGQRPSDEALMAMHQFSQELEKAGVLVEAVGLTPSSRGVRVRYHKSKATVVDGPFTESKELIAGYMILEVRSIAEAVEWAKRAPFGVGAPEGEDPVVEIRPLFDPSEFDVPGEAEERAKRK